MYEFNNLSFIQNGDTYIYPSNFNLNNDCFNIILGPTLAGKTTLLRLIAGLEKPTAGNILKNGKSITELSAKRRNVSLVYQQFINYPNLTVAENISSPMRAEKRPSDEIKREVKTIAEKLKITPYLNRYPHELSGGQQQRTAIGRALAKSSDIILFDEPLVNLDYKLREELREEIPKIMQETSRVLVYSTTEPHEALMLPGNLITLFEGRITDTGSTERIYKNPANLTTAKVFSYPPLNTIKMKYTNGRFKNLDNSLEVIPSPEHSLKEGEEYTLAIRPHRLKPERESTASISNEIARFKGKVIFTEIAGSDSYVHLETHNQKWVIHDHRLIDYRMDEVLMLSVLRDDWMIFDSSDQYVPKERE